MGNKIIPATTGPVHMDSHKFSLINRTIRLRAYETQRETHPSIILHWKKRQIFNYYNYKKGNMSVKIAHSISGRYDEKEIALPS